MTNLDRFSRESVMESFYVSGEEKKMVVAECEQCDRKLYEGKLGFTADGMDFCDTDCFLDWSIEYFKGEEVILKGEE